MVNKLKQLVVEEEGQGLSEYGLVLAGVVAVVAIAVALLETEIRGLFTNLLP
ncbi:pilus assembly protein Flp/PilA [[Bacillus] enclensis]|uniref:Pilus assembly protein Flp/PilA n=1 Tax=[Bacillus] enclensis TaxID=1402860 RepID=A0A1C4CU07_9BACI|nr:Flp family type IVb pilin [[Bacillus] enclensis]SCC22558.1 pilus assembly protein Flp/PilA [[Bacillus] enclensis]